jgi:hypothetical protein
VLGENFSKKSEGVVNADVAKLRTRDRYTRAWANFEVIEVLHQREEREWVRFARIRQRAEKQSAPDDVLPAQPNTGNSRRRK